MVPCLPRPSDKHERSFYASTTGRALRRIQREMGRCRSYRLSATFEKRPSYWSERSLRVVGEGITGNETLIIADVAHARLGPVRENWCNTRARNDSRKQRRIS